MRGGRKRDSKAPRPPLLPKADVEALEAPNAADGLATNADELWLNEFELPLKLRFALNWLEKLELGALNAAIWLDLWKDGRLSAERSPLRKRGTM